MYLRSLCMLEWYSNGNTSFYFTPYICYLPVYLVCHLDRRWQIRYYFTVFMSMSNCGN